MPPKTSPFTAFRIWTVPDGSTIPESFGPYETHEEVRDALEDLGARPQPGTGYFLSPDGRLEVKAYERTSHRMISEGLEAALRAPSAG